MHHLEPDSLWVHREPLGLWRDEAEWLELGRRERLELRLDEVGWWARALRGQLEHLLDAEEWSGLE
ncbi:MAG: hypothetical protein RIR37_1247 [Verrucomicrobiota bacterium]